MIAEADIWIYGFDTFTPKNMQVIERLLMAARSVNVVLTYDSGEYFSLTRYIMDSFMEMAAQRGIESHVKAIDGTPR